MTERDFWVTIRQALLLFVSAIDKRYKLGKHAEGKIQPIGENDNLTST